MLTEGVPVGAIPFCNIHEQGWQEDCDGCNGGRLVAEQFDEHRAVFPACTMWPLCNCSSSRPPN